MRPRASTCPRRRPSCTMTLALAALPVGHLAEPRPRCAYELRLSRRTRRASSKRLSRTVASRRANWAICARVARTKAAPHDARRVAERCRCARRRGPGRATAVKNGATASSWAVAASRRKTPGAHPDGLGEGEQVRAARARRACGSFMVVRSGWGRWAAVRPASARRDGAPAVLLCASPFSHGAADRPRRARARGITVRRASRVSAARRGC